VIGKLLAAEGQNLPREEFSKIPVEIGLQGEDGYPHAGHLDYVAPRVDASSGTLLVRGELENKGRDLVPGLFARVRVPVARHENALLVRDHAIGTNQQGSYVLVLGSDDAIAQKQVKLGAREGGLRAIESGLDAGDWVVTQGLQRAAVGGKVTPQKGEMVPEESATANIGKTGTP
jgi:membrane fusion protein, multidrug efflux system